MFETIMSRSRGATTSRMSASTCLMYWLVNSRRVPVGALRLITNWPGSVRGKKPSPMNGNSAKLNRQIPRIPTTVPKGRSRLRLTAMS